jgi:thioredoxin 1
MSALISNDTFQAEVLKFPGTVLVDFYTDGCGPCRMMAPILEDVAREQPDLKIVKIDAASDPELAASFRVSAVPTFLLFVGGEVRGQFVGMRSKKDLMSWLSSIR